MCSDTDNDTCDDCSSGSYNVGGNGSQTGDGWDYDGDGACDAGDTDDDNDNALDENDTDDNNEFICSDDDNDTCNDCSSGVYDVTDDGADNDLGWTNNGANETLCDAGDPDDDNDGSLDVDDSNDFNPVVLSFLSMIPVFPIGVKSVITVLTCVSGRCIFTIIFSQICFHNYVSQLFFITIMTHHDAVLLLCFLEASDQARL